MGKLSYQRMNELIGKRLREARKASGWNLQDLANRSDISVGQLSKLENGHAALKIPSLMRLARELKRPIGYFLQTDSDMLRSLGTLVPSWDAEGQAIERFAALVEEKTGAALSIAVFSGSQLGTAVSQIDALMEGIIDMFVEYIGFLERFAEPARLASLPFCFDDDAHYHRFLRSKLFDRKVRRVLRARSIELPSPEWNWKRGRHLVLVGKRPIIEPDQLRGVRVRTHESEVWIKFLEELGAIPVVVPWVRVYEAFAQNEFDVMVTELSHIVSMRVTRIAPYITILGDKPTDLIIGMNAHKYDMLAPSIQNALAEAAVEAGKYCAELVHQAEDDLPRLLDEDGGVISQVGTKIWRERSRSSMRKLEQAGLWHHGMLDEIMNL